MLTICWISFHSFFSSSYNFSTLQSSCLGHPSPLPFLWGFFKQNSRVINQLFQISTFTNIWKWSEEKQLFEKYLPLFFYFLSFPLFNKLFLLAFGNKTSWTVTYWILLHISASKISLATFPFVFIILSESESQLTVSWLMEGENKTCLLTFSGRKRQEMKGNLWTQVRNF